MSQQQLLLLLLLLMLHPLKHINTHAHTGILYKTSHVFTATVAFVFD